MPPSSQTDGELTLEQYVQMILQIQSKMKGELHLKEYFIPNDRAEAKCSIFVSPKYKETEKLCIFLQAGKDLQPGIWSKDIAYNSGSQGASMLSYFHTAIQSGFSLIIMNPTSNVALVRGHKAHILHSSNPQEHVLYVWEKFVAPYSAKCINFIVYDSAGVLVKYLITKIDPDMRKRINAIAFISSTHQLSNHDPEWLEFFLEKKAINFELSSQSLFNIINKKNKLGCTCLSAGGGTIGFTNHSSNGKTNITAVSLVLNAIQTSVFIFLQAMATTNGVIKEAVNALRATIPNKLVVTVNRACLTGQPYNNPYAVIQCVGQKKETIGNHKHTMDPEWNQTFSFPVSNSENILVVTIKDRTFPISTSLGQIKIPMTEVAQNRVQRRWYTLQSEKAGNDITTSHGNGEVELTLEWVHDTFVARSDSFIRGQRDNNNNNTTMEGTIHGSDESEAGINKDLENHIEDKEKIEKIESNCYLCYCNFMLHRKRHCRMCLRAVCVGCSDRLFLPGFNEAKRVCTACCNLQIMMHKKGTTKIDKTVVDEAVRNVERMQKKDKEEDIKPMTIHDFDLLKVVGRGAFGKVLLVKKKSGKNKGSIYAMKILKKAHIIKNDQIENTKAEQHILKEINHPFVVRLRFAFQNEDKLYLVMDYYPGGSMFYHLRKSKRFTEERTCLYMAQLLTALMHLHSKQIAYRDLKLENILMDPQGNIALTDFGLSKENQATTNPSSTDENGMKTICGTAEYMAPELLRHQRYGKVVDWWSYGILLYEMLTGRTPFVDRNRRQMFKNIMTQDVVFPPYVSSTAKSLITKLLERDPLKRLGSGANGGKDIMAHPFFNSINWDKLLKKEIKPVFLPEVSSIDDVTNVPQMFQNMEAIDSPVSNTNGSKETHHFEDFSFQEESRLRKGHN